jgi:hypothetical protein
MWITDKFRASISGTIIDILCGNVNSFFVNFHQKQSKTTVFSADNKENCGKAYLPQMLAYRAQYGV